MNKRDRYLLTNKTTPIALLQGWIGEREGTQGGPNGKFFLKLLLKSIFAVVLMFLFLFNFRYIRDQEGKGIGIIRTNSHY